MSPQRFQQVRKLFEDALEVDTANRAALVAEACQNDPELESEVLKLLDAHDATITLRADASSKPDRVESGSRAGQHLGDYEILRELGKGGMGRVYLARRADDAFHKEVAIKILRADAASSDVIKRFQREREILAQLDHPNIARLLDAGETEEGLPYFVMEYVDGRSITQYSDDQRLLTRERIELFRQACDAVEYAHQRKIVHRDLKPGNVLVTTEGQVKLLDFGIARLLEQDAGLASLTVTGMWLMTPEYASPEQVRGEEVGRATDIYSLGVILFELLTGHRPYRLRSRIFHEVVRVVCEEPPTRPSLVITQPVESTTADGKATTLPAETAGLLRQASLEELKRQLSGDLDNILLKALDKQASQRYGSAREFGEDLGRQLAGLSVSAKGASLLYLTRKLAWRHRWWVAAMLALTAAIATGAVRISPLVAIDAGVVLLTVTLGYYIARTEFGKAAAVRGAFPQVVFMVVVMAVGWEFVKFVPNHRQWLAIFFVTLGVWCCGLLIRWKLRSRWTGVLLLDASRPRTRTPILLLFLMIFALTLYVADSLQKWMSGGVSAATYDLAYIAGVGLSAALQYVAWGTVEARSKGLLSGGGFLPWNAIESYSWDPTGAALAILRVKRIGRPGWASARMPMLPARKEEMATILVRQLGEWPAPENALSAPLAGAAPSAVVQETISTVFSPPVWLGALVMVLVSIAAWGLIKKADLSRSGLHNPEAPTTRAARDAVTAFHQKLSQGQYKDLCEGAEPHALSAGVNVSCAEYFAYLHGRLGNVMDTRLTQTAGQVTRPAGEPPQVELHYTTRYERGEARENFVWRIDNDVQGTQPTLTSFDINSDALRR